MVPTPYDFSVEVQLGFYNSIMLHNLKQKYIIIYFELIATIICMVSYFTSSFTMLYQVLKNVCYSLIHVTIFYYMSQHTTTCHNTRLHATVV